MKIAMVNKWDKGSGAARAVWRLFVALKNAGERVQYVVHEQTEADERVVKVDISKPVFCDLEGLIQKYYIDQNRTTLSNTYFSHTLSHVDWLDIPAIADANVINLHWVEKFSQPEVWPRLLQPENRLYGHYTIRGHSPEVVTMRLDVMASSKQIAINVVRSKTTNTIFRQKLWHTSSTFSVKPTLLLFSPANGWPGRQRQVSCFGTSRYM